MKHLYHVTEKVKPRDLHAEIRTTARLNDEGYVIDDGLPVIRVHFAENEDQWKSGIIRIEIGKEVAEVSIDALMTTIFTAYDPTILRKTVGYFEHIVIRFLSFFLRK